MRAERIRAGPALPSYLALHHAGFSVPSRSLETRWALTPPFHPYHARRLFFIATSRRFCLPAITETPHRRFIFCGTFRRRFAQARTAHLVAAKRRPGVTRRVALWLGPCGPKPRCPDFPPARRPKALSQRSPGLPATPIIPRVAARRARMCTYATHRRAALRGARICANASQKIAASRAFHGIFGYNAPQMATITFLGAAGTVTGSKYLVEAAGKRLLIDCGIFQGSRDLRQRNWDHQPLDVSTIDYAVLTHAHLDHTGWLPCLLRDGYRGPIFADAATIELVNILLPDSAHIMEEDALDAAKRGLSRHKPPLPLYTHEQVPPVLAALKQIPREGASTISPQFTVRLRDAGHILGSTNIELTITESGRTTTVLFSGDIGRYSQPILKDPEPAAPCDVLICESTYGDRDHPTNPPDIEIADVINRVAKRGGVIVVPAFAVGRTQTLAYVVRQLEDAGRIPRLPVYIDSPMAISVTSLYLGHREDHNAQFL